MKIKTIILSTAAFLTLSSFSYSQTTSPTESTDSVKQERIEGRRINKRVRSHGGGKIMNGLKDLNLSDSQKAEIKTLHETSKSKFQPQRIEMKALAGKKRDGIITADEETRFKSLREEMKASKKSSNDSLMNILTVEQKAQLEQKRTEMREKMRQRRGQREEKKPITPDN
jgi:Spy/CpxP family protein refolding chaperone